MFQRRDELEPIRYIVEYQGALIATVFTECLPYSTWPHNRFIHFEAEPANMTARWLNSVLAFLADADRNKPHTWHVVNVTEASISTLAPLLEAEGFVRHSSMLQMVWTGEAVAVVDPSPAHFRTYAGGDLETDQAIVDLHNRAYRWPHMVPPADVESLWKAWPGLKAHEYVLAIENNRLVGYAEWLEPAGKPPVINSFVVTRSHWGTPIGRAVASKAMQILLERGHRKIEGIVRSNNAAALRVHREFGSRVACETAHILTRRL